MAGERETGEGELYRIPYWLACLLAEGCLLCGGPAGVLGVFVPDDPAAYNLGRPPEGRRRVVYYVLCPPCAQGSPLERIEREIRWRAAIRAN